MPEVTGWSFHLGELDRDDVRALLEFHFNAMRGNSPPEACHVLPSDGLSAPDISFWSLRENGRLLIFPKMMPRFPHAFSPRTAGLPSIGRRSQLTIRVAPESA